MSRAARDPVELLRGLVAISSTSGDESRAVTYLVDQMKGLGYSRTFVDEAGNAVGEMGPADAEHVVVLLGHIDTVPGDIPVGIEEMDGNRVLYGRGSVDAKGPLATFCSAVADLGVLWAEQHRVRLVVVGAVEEEAATSRGARFIRDRFDGDREPRPAACIIGEPSSWARITLGYKGRLLVDIEAAQPMAHTAGPDAGIATVAVDFWNWIASYASKFNQGKERAFEQLLPSLRALDTWTDEAMHDRVRARSGIRLPLNFGTDAFVNAICDWASGRAGLDNTPAVPALTPGESANFCLNGNGFRLKLDFSSYEPAWRSDRNNPLVRSFLAGIRDVGDVRPAFVVKTGTSDMNVVGPAWECPIVAYGPGDSSLDHTPDEHIHLDEYHRAIRVLVRSIRYLVEMW